MSNVVNLRTGKTLDMVRRLPADRSVLIIVLNIQQIDYIKQMIFDFKGRVVMNNVKFLPFNKDTSYYIRGKRRDEIFVDHSVFEVKEKQLVNYLNDLIITIATMPN
jgi:hypothetical protein